ncbi:protein FAR1-RELATED SEQUENCE 6-like [Chenopodium quinoa]|uniref:protein FAR1-RELATED SEQUENCE 6-like n=1 Tax=Chenopodium quinoa TaxID=63459 RepID=UPI000B772C3E|nr:protein FAR1-RELATED SEQUENCE 6-like [Chenopodium quinoa]
MEGHMEGCQYLDVDSMEGLESLDVDNREGSESLDVDTMKGLESLHVDSTEVKNEALDVEGMICEGGCIKQNSEQFMSPLNSIGTLETVVGSNNVSGMNIVEPPKIGMIFKSWQDVESYYKEYAQQQGFGVTRAQGVYSKGEVRDHIATTWKCECWDRPDMRAVREAKKRAKAMDVSGSVVGDVGCVEDLRQRKRKSKKCPCQAKLYASLNHDGEWEIKKVQLEHTHDPTPRKAKLVKEYRMRKFNSRARKNLLNFYEQGVPVTQIHGCFASQANGNLEYTVKDLQHEFYKARRKKTAGDREGRLKDVIWVDGRSRAAYEEFGDVVCFDATYITNEYQLPFVNFVGVNQHGQTILLGCASVAHEDIDTFRWIFQEWLSCMNNKVPVAILTDQAAAMRGTIEEVLPSMRHLWCIWHIMRKIPEKLGKCERYKDFKPVLKAVVYESLNVEEFESRWVLLIREYDLENNDWLSSLYTERHMWVPAFMRDYFWAGMKKTQRVESITSFFDGFVNRKTKLFEFPAKYAMAMRKRVRDESAADANCAKYVRRLVTGFTAEKFFQGLYTDTKFREVQTECTRIMHCYSKEKKMLDANIIEYEVEDRVWSIPEGKSEEVLTDRKNHVVEIPQKYVVNRWRKDIKRKHTEVEVSYHNSDEDEVMKKYNKLLGEFEELFDDADLVNDEAVELVSNALKHIRNELEQCRLKKAAESVSMSCPEQGKVSGLDASDTPNTMAMPNTRDDTELEDQVVTVKDPVRNKSPRGRLYTEEYTKTEDQVITVKDPVRIKKPRGRPKGSRNKTLAEMIQGKIRKNTSGVKGEKANVGRAGKAKNKEQTGTHKKTGRPTTKNPIEGIVKLLNELVPIKELLRTERFIIRKRKAENDQRKADNQKQAATKSLNV